MTIYLAHTHAHTESGIKSLKSDTIDTMPGGGTQCLGRPSSPVSQSYIGYLNPYRSQYPCVICVDLAWNGIPKLLLSLLFVSAKVDQARLAPEELKGHSMDMYGVHVCTSLLYNNVCCFLCLCVLRKNPNKPTQIECDLLSLSSQDQSQILVVLPFFSQRPFSQDS